MLFRSQILNLDYLLSSTGGTGATVGFVNTAVSSTGTASLGSGSGTYTHAISSPTGGFASYTYSGGYSSGTFTDSNPTITVTVTDNVGCTKTITG